MRTEPRMEKASVDVLELWQFTLAKDLASVSSLITQVCCCGFGFVLVLSPGLLLWDFAALQHLQRAACQRPAHKGFLVVRVPL